MKRIIILGAAFVALLIVLPVAAKPVPSGTIAIAAGSDLALGGVATFDVTHSGLPANKFFVGVQCSQGGAIVYSEDSQVTIDTSVVLGQYGTWESGSAECTASLWYWGRGQGDNTEVATLNFTAGG
jgi:hypothetical protein